MKIVVAVLSLFSALTTAQPQSTPQQSSVEWVSTLQSAVLQNWSRPGNLQGVTRCRVSVTLAPDGSVELVAIKESCGSKELEQSVRTAVLRSSPLPLPGDPAVFARHLVLNFVVR
jgi:colicin import membrane protein